MYVNCIIDYEFDIKEEGNIHEYTYAYIQIVSCTEKQGWKRGVM